MIAKRFDTTTDAGLLSIFLMERRRLKRKTSLILASGVYMELSLAAETSNCVCCKAFRENIVFTYSSRGSGCQIYLT